MMERHRCAECPIRAKHDKNPKSLTGKFWRWHIGFCPGWRKYFVSLDSAEQDALRRKYGLKK